MPIPTFERRDTYWTTLRNKEVAVVVLDRDTSDFAHLLGRLVMVDGYYRKCVAVERYAHMEPWRRGEMIGLMLTQEEPFVGKLIRFFTRQPPRKMLSAVDVFDMKQVGAGPAGGRLGFHGGYIAWPGTGTGNPEQVTHPLIPPAPPPQYTGRARSRRRKAPPSASAVASRPASDDYSPAPDVSTVAIVDSMLNALADDTPAAEPASTGYHGGGGDYGGGGSSASWGDSGSSSYDSGSSYDGGSSGGDSGGGGSD